MAEFEHTPVTFRVAAYVVAGIVSVISFLVWMDDRVNNRITERIIPLELRLTAIERSINSSDLSRLQQYDELRDLLREIRDARRLERD